MQYDYEDMKTALFTDEGQRIFLQIRDRTNRLLAETGAVRCQEAISKASGDSWLMLACIDRMVELGEIREVVHMGPRFASQHRIFIKA